MTTESPNFPWLRRIRVTFEGGGLSDREFISTGKNDAYNITAHIHKEIMGMPPSTELSLHNLNSATRSILENNKIRATIQAGWDEGPRKGLKEVFCGELLAARSRRQGPDIVTALSCLSGINSLPTAREITTFPAGYLVRDAVNMLAEKIEGIKEIKINGVHGKIASGGRTVSATVKTELTRLAKEFSFSWTIVDNVFCAVGDSENMGNCAELKEPYLMSVNPILTGPMRIVNGIGWQCTFDADINPGYFVSINSKLASRHNGKYRVNTITHYLNCFEDAAFISAGHAYTLGKQ